MKNINILSLVQAKDSLTDESFSNYLKHYGPEIRDGEINDLKSLVEVLKQSENKDVFNQFYIGYKIPQIGKEFDLLRFGTDCIINIELKSTSTEEKIEKQLKRNKYYLSFIGKEIHNFTFVSDSPRFYYLNASDVLEKVDSLYLIQLLENQQKDNIEDVDSLFNPSDYLVSPFNSTDKFINGGYFLTQQQEDIKRKVLQMIGDGSQANFVSITGNAGTGKTLLVYDLAKEIEESGKTILVVHCGYLNSGQTFLNETYGWSIIPIKAMRHHRLSDYDVVVIDEAQRIKPNQLDNVIQETRASNGSCIFSYDKLQTLSNGEARRNIEDKINNINPINQYNLSEKIRTNKEIASFITALFNQRRNDTARRSDKIELNYFNNVDDTKKFLETLDSQEWEIIRFTPSQYNVESHGQYSGVGNETSHGIIGQEFEGVVIIIDQFFAYNQDGQLIYTGSSYYDAVKMLFQNVTRTRKRLNVVIINNSALLDRCISILNN